MLVWWIAACVGRRNLTPASNVCEPVLISLFWRRKGLNELPEVRFQSPRGTPYICNDIYGKALLEKGAFYRLQVANNFHELVLQRFQGAIYF